MTQLSDQTAIIEISDSAVKKIYGLIESRGRGKLAVRVILRGRMPGGGFQSEFKFVDLDEKGENDIVQETKDFPFYFDQECAESIQGARVDFDESKYSSGFNIDYPQQIADNPGAVEKEWSNPVAVAVQKVIIEEINPGVAAHAGWVDLLDVQEDIAYVEMGGGCQGCGLSDVTMKQGIERLIIDRVPQIATVVDTTEHAEGNNPYYTPAKGGEIDSSESPLAQ